MHADHSVFLDALRDKRRLTVKFFDRKEKRDRVRVCAPLDHGPLRGASDATPRYQLWDLEGKRKPLNLALFEHEIASMTMLGETFDPAAIITWTFKPDAWTVPRDWAEFS